MKKVISQCFARQLSVPILQKVFEGLMMLCYYGMNKKNDGSLRYSGEKLVLSIIKTFTKNKKEDPIVVFDVGANEGSYSLLVSDIFMNLPVRIFAFEPSKHIFEKLKINVAENANININNFGFGEKAEDLILYRSVRNSGSSSLHDYSKINIFEGKESPIPESVQIKRIDQIFNEFNLKKITLLKLDIEGHEIYALKSAKVLIENSLIDFIQFEFGGNCVNSRVFFKDFWDLLSDRYFIYRMLPKSIFPIDNYSFKEEVFFTTNFFCINKDLEMDHIGT